MDKIIYIIKIVSVIQLALIIFFVGLMYLTRVFLAYTEKRRKKKRHEIITLLDSCFENNASLASSPECVIKLKKSIVHVLYWLHEQETIKNNPEGTKPFITELSDLVLKPSARKLAPSRSWLNRYTAVLCYDYGFNQEDYAALCKLIDDKIILVSINAARISVKYGIPELINEIITVFSHRRRLQQSAYAELLMEESIDIASIIEKRLQEDKNLYVRIFCYRLLLKTPKKNKIIDIAKHDLQTDSIDLKIAILKYVDSVDDDLKNEIIYGFSEDAHWEVQAVVAKLLCDVNSQKSLELLEEMLTNPQWWVRINAAQSLGKKGQKGIDILKKQSLATDKFAYETASEVLKELEIYG